MARTYFDEELNHKERSREEEHDQWQELADNVQKVIHGINRVAFEFPEPVRIQIERLIDAKIALALWEKDHYDRGN